ncbi:MAG: phosphoribosylanthranilate isomerase [Burkholderiales bacterium]|nr:phosphoribosylanthranilate isomerase [Burkholderiales bacterium]
MSAAGPPQGARPLGGRRREAPLRGEHFRTRVKICGITRVADGLAASSAGADAIGLVFWSGTPRVVDVGCARAIAEALPPFVTRVGLFVDPEPAEVRAVMDAVALDLLQFHGAEAADFCRAFGRPYLKAIHMKDGVDLLECVSAYPDAAGLLFDSYAPGELPGGTGRAFDWSRLSPLVQAELSASVILSGGLDPANVGEAIRAVRPWAVDVSSGVEERDPDGRARRGSKDAARIAAFIEGVRNADG